MAGVRRTWDKDFYEKKARDRADQGDDYHDGDGPAAKSRKVMKEEFKAADDGAAGPAGSQRAFLQSRVNKIDLDQKVGKVEMINPTSAGDYRGAGFWCETCSCLLKDSASYLDHINGKKRKLLSLCHAT
jgi:U4/U6.U5 tri-snRNP component SNU23